jgi:hypothetical protein
MKKLSLLIVLFVFASGFTLLAQTKVITGTITSAVQGEGAIPGVQRTSKCDDSCLYLCGDETSGG